MNIINRKNIIGIEDTCGLLQELFHSKNISISYATINKDSIPHKHLITEEVYTIIKGKAKLQVGNDIYDIQTGDTISIPLNTYHHIHSIQEHIEMIVVTHPKFSTEDVIY